MTPVPYLFLRIIWTAHRVQFPLLMPVFNIKEVRVSPEPAAPFGRKGLVLASAWKQLAKPDTAGVLFLDGDVVVDPHDVMMMLLAINKDPAAVHIAPAKLWPVTMGDAPGWVWGHCRNAEWSQVMTMDPDFFAFNFTYVPRKVIETAIGKGLRGKVFPEVDRHVSKTARELGTRMSVVEDCYPKHMHY